MRIGLYGGSFDPIHSGHLRPVREAMGELALDRVFYLPTACPPHKPHRAFAPAYARFTMVELALLDEAGLYASPFELRQGVESYTIDTVEHFQAAEPTAELVLIVGSDAFAELPQWRRWRAILRRVGIGVMARPGASEAAPEAPPPEIEAALAAGRVRRLANRPVAVSATVIRRELAAGREPPAGFLHRSVLHYIQKYGLYRQGLDRQEPLGPASGGGE